MLEYSAKNIYGNIKVYDHGGSYFDTILDNIEFLEYFFWFAYLRRTLTCVATI